MHIDITETVTRAVGANFSAAIIAICDNLDDYSCEIEYRFTDEAGGRFGVQKGSPINSSGILNIPNTTLTVLYTYIKEVRITPRIILNFTIISRSKHEFQFTVKSAILCRGTLATVRFIGK